MAILFTITTASSLLFSILRKLYLRRCKTPTGFAFFVAAIALTAFICYFFWAIGKDISLTTALFGVLFGVATFFSHYFCIKALEKGSYSITMLVSSFSTVIPALSGLFLGEKISVTQIIGIILITAFFIIQFLAERQSTSKGWLWLCVGTFVTIGAIGVLQKVHQSGDTAFERASFLWVAFTVFSVIALGYLMIKLVKSRREKLIGGDESAATSAGAGFKWLAVVIAVASGLCIIVNNQLNLYLVGVTTSAMFFPFASGLTAVFNVVIGILLFKERFSFKSVILMIVGIAAIVLVCI